MTTSRTVKSIKNSVVSLAFYIVNLIIGFVSRKIFLDYLGADVLGLNTTAQNLLQFLNLAELGIGGAVGYFLYKPLEKNDYNSVNEIVTLQGILYKRIAIIILGGSLVLLPFFPLIFHKIELPLWYAFASFGAFLFASLLGYFVNYRQIVLSSNQQNYKIQYSYQSVMILRSVVQIIVISNFADPFLWWIVTHVIFTLIGSISLHLVTMRTFPFLKDTGQNYKELSLKYPQFATKIKQLFFHKIGGFVLTQTSGLIIYAYANLTLVAYYGNYMMIITGVTMLIYAMFNSVDAGIGNLVAEGNKGKILKVFREMFSLRFALCMMICYLVFNLTPSFIQLWIGEQYQLPTSTLAIMTVILYINLFRYSTDSFIAAYGLFSDIGSPLIEAILNLGLSILLGYYFGLNGILSGVVISLIVVICCWKPYFLFSRGFGLSIFLYISIYLKHIILGAISWILSICIIRLFVFNIQNSILDFIFQAVLHFVTFSIIICTILIATKSGLELSLKRICRLKLSSDKTYNKVKSN